MAEPIGQWHINANGFKGTMNINGDGQGNLNGTVDIDTGFQDQLQGVWNEAAQEIVFNRVLIRNNRTLVQTYTGYRYTTREPFFEGRGAPDPNPDFFLLTGYFDAIGTGAANRRAFFGWAARRRLTIGRPPGGGGGGGNEPVE